MSSDAVERLRQREAQSLLHEAELREHETNPETDHVESDKGFGKKTIGFWGSFCLNVNNCMGPAMVLLPLLNQQAGWFTPTLAMILVWFLSSLAATMLCESMQRIPGNFTFEHRYEFATIVRHYYGKTAYILFQIFYNLSMQATNIAAMVISAQVVDTFIHKIAGASYAFQYQHWPPSFIKSTGSADFPWCMGQVTQEGCDGLEPTFLISIGFLVCMAICIPFGYLNLDENMWFQWLSLVGLFGFTLEFYGQFIYNFNRNDKLCIPDAYGNQTCNYHPDNKVGNYSHNGFYRTPFVTDSLAGHSQVLGIAIFAYAYIVTIPSWVNEKKHKVSVNKAVWVPASVGLAMKILTGLLGGWAYWLVMPNGQQRPNSDDILNILLLEDQPLVTQYCAYLWDITTLIPGIPVLAIMVRYNLLSGGVSNRFWSFFWGVVLPWIVTLFFYEASILQEFCNWVAIVLQGFINFVVPAMLYRTALKKYPDHSQPYLSVADPVLLKSRLTPVNEATADFDENDESKPLLSTSSQGSIDNDVGVESGRKNGSPSRRRVTFSQSEINEMDDNTVFETLKSLDLPHSGDAETRLKRLQEQPVNAIPRFIAFGNKVIFLNRILIADIMIWFFSILSVAVIGFSIVVEVMGLN